MIKRNLFLLLLTLAGSAEAISFQDYYHGNEELGIPSHKKEVDAGVADGVLGLQRKKLTDLIGFDEIPGLTALEEIYLNNNQLTALPANIFNGLSALQFLNLSYNQFTALPDNLFNGLTSLRILELNDNQLTALPADLFHGLTALQKLDLYNNPISLTEEQLLKELQLPANINLRFKTREQKWAERKLFVAIGNADAVTFRDRLAEIMAERDRERISTVMGTPIVVSKIRDAKGNNLLHAAIKEAAKRIKVIDKELENIRRDEELSADEKKTATSVLLEQKREINDRYMKIMSAILSCGEECVQDMLFTPNAEGQQVIDAIFADLGFNSPIYKAILEGLTPEEKAKETQEKKEKGEA